MRSALCGSAWNAFDEISEIIHASFFTVHMYNYILSVNDLKLFILRAHRSTVVLPLCLRYKAASCPLVTAG